jgi:F5/8 type C domain/Alpha-L-fucosidase
MLGVKFFRIVSPWEVKKMLSRLEALISLIYFGFIRVCSKTTIILFLVVIFGLAGFSNSWAARQKTDWLRDARWGVMTHYLTNSSKSSKDWNDQVNSFDVKGLAQQLKSAGVKYYMISIGQNSGHYCAPNSKYDYYTKISPSKCSRRDLISDIYDAIHPFGIKLMVYLPSGAPGNDGVAINGLEWTSGANRNRSFQLKWESVIREWSLRWGKKVSGWWFDGVYWPKEMYGHEDAPNFQSFSAAAKAGNPDSIVAFNPGPRYPLMSLSDSEDFTAGEIFDARGISCENRWVKKSQFHILSYLGNDWGSGSSRYRNEEIADISRNINKCGGVVTWDVPIDAGGKLPKAFVDQLIALNKENKSGYPARKNKLTSLQNVALQKTARLLDPSGEKELPVNGTKHFPGLGLDGDLKTFALAGNSWSWIYQADLAEVYPITRVSVTFGASYATEYKILSSKDGLRWSVLKHEKTARGGKYNYKFSRTQMRYLRVYGIKPNGPNQPGGQMSVAELEAYQ